MRKLVAMLLIVLGSSGCASVMSLSQDKRPYGGVRFDLTIVAYPFSSSESRGGAPTDGLAAVAFIPCLIDTPFSFVLDTITLPYTGIRALRKKDKPTDSNKVLENTGTNAPDSQH